MCRRMADQGIGRRYTTRMNRPEHTLRPLVPAELARVQSLQAELGMGDAVTLARWKDLQPVQDQLANVLDVAHGPANAREVFRVMRDQTDPSPLVGPRWWFHLLGVRHGAVHIVLTTPQGWFVAQRRSQDKDDAPGALDVAVSGHIGNTDYLAAAWRELTEEVGLTQSATGEAPSLVGNTLHRICAYDAASLVRAGENPPFLDRERREVFHAQLTAEGLARLRFSDGEVSSLLLVGPRDLHDLARRCANDERTLPGELDLAPGLIGTLPRWMRYVEGPHP